MIRDDLYVFLDGFHQHCSPEKYQGKVLGLQGNGASQVSHVKVPQSDRAIVTTPSQASGLLQKGQPGKEDVNQHKTKILFRGLKSKAITST